MSPSDNAPPLHKKIAILLWAGTPDRPELCHMPFVYAAVAAAMDCEVELHFTGPAVRLLVDGVAANLRPKAGEKSIYGYMQDASEQGARFLGCSLALRDYLAPEEMKIAEFSGTAGAATFIMRTLDPEWRVMYF